jgi:hypothetical protein
MLQTNPRDRFQNAAELSSGLKKVAAQLDPMNFRSRMVDAKATGWRGALDGF